MDGWHGVGQSAWGSLRNPCPRPRRSALSSLRSPFHPYSRKVTATRQVLIHALASIRPRLTLEYYSGVVLGREGLFFVWVNFSPWQTIGWLCNLRAVGSERSCARVCDRRPKKQGSSQTCEKKEDGGLWTGLLLVACLLGLLVGGLTGAAHGRAAHHRARRGGLRPQAGRGARRLGPWPGWRALAAITAR